MPATVFCYITNHPKTQWLKTMDIVYTHNSAVWAGFSCTQLSHPLLLILPMAAHVDYPAGRSLGTWTWLGCWDDQACLSGPLPLMWLLQGPLPFMWLLQWPLHIALAGKQNFVRQIMALKGTKHKLLKA